MKNSNQIDLDDVLFLGNLVVPGTMSFDSTNIVSDGSGGLFVQSLDVANGSFVVAVSGDMKVTNITDTSGVISILPNTRKLRNSASAVVFDWETGSIVTIGSDLSVASGNLVLSTSTGTKIGTATSQKLAFHNSTPVIQRVGAAQVAVATTASTNVVPFGFATAAQADAIVTLVNELRAALVQKGLIKGAA